MRLVHANAAMSVTTARTYDPGRHERRLGWWMQATATRAGSLRVKHWKSQVLRVAPVSRGITNETPRSRPPNTQERREGVA